MPKLVKSHRLIIKSLRDLMACCACGNWELTRTTTDCESDQELKDQAYRSWFIHLATRQHGKDGA